MTSSTDTFHLHPIAPDGTVETLGPPWPDDVAPVVEMTRTFYSQVGHQPPWISYIATVDGNIVGGGGFVGAPNHGEIEIAYFTRRTLENRGYATRTASALIDMARLHEATIVIVAKTLPHPNKSTRILERVGFQLTGSTQDHEIGDAWLWKLRSRYNRNIG